MPSEWMCLSGPPLGRVRRAVYLPIIGFCILLVMIGAISAMRTPPNIGGAIGCTLMCVALVALGRMGARLLCEVRVREGMIAITTPVVSTLRPARTIIRVSVELRAIEIEFDPPIEKQRRFRFNPVDAQSQEVLKLAIEQSKREIEPRSPLRDYG